jgi:hypothetical protein
MWAGYRSRGPSWAVQLGESRPFIHKDVLVTKDSIMGS